MLLTRAPLYSWYCYHFLVRLACVRHAASVDSEPGSNSRLKPVVNSLPTEVGYESTASAHLFFRLLRRRGCVQMLLPCENDQAKLNHISRLACSTNLSKILARVRLSGLVGSRPRLASGCPRTCLRTEICALPCTHRHFCANLPNISNLPLHVNPRS